MTSSKVHRVAVIGAGRQGLAQCRALRSLTGVQLAGLADYDEKKLNAAADSLKLPAEGRFTDATEMIRRCAPLELVSIATTAPSHLGLAQFAADAGIRRIIIEKPLDTSLLLARRFLADCRARGVLVCVNYSRRWMPDYLAMKRCIDTGYIGSLRCILVSVGKGELAMHGSHYFDLARFLFDASPRTAFSHLSAPLVPNDRGAEFSDPTGFCVFTFDAGQRLFVDMSDDLCRKSPILVVQGSAGRIVIDEDAGRWSLLTSSALDTSFRFSEPLRSATLFARVAADALSNPPVTPSDGLDALEMVFGAALSQRKASEVALPLPDGDADLGLMFP